MATEWRADSVFQEQESRQPYEMLPRTYKDEVRKRSIELTMWRVLLVAVTTISVL